MEVFNQKYRFVDNWFVERIFKGLTEDVNMLYRCFLKTDLKFSSFASLWRRHQFMSIFGERYLPAEAMEYTEGVLHFSKGFIFSHDIKAVVFGIYFVYAVYSKQPMKGKISKLRLTLAEFRKLKDNFYLLREQKHEEAAEIFMHMFRSSAFLYVASSITGGIERGNRKYFKAADNNEREPTKATDPFDKTLLDSFQSVHQLYEEKKKETGDSAAFEEKSDFFEQMKKQFEEFGQPIELETVEAVLEQTESKGDGHGTLRRELKNKAFKKGTSDASSSKTPDQPVTQNIKRKKQIKIEFKPEPGAVPEEETLENNISFDLNVFD